MQERLILETEKLILKEPAEEDIPAILAFLHENKLFHRPFEPIRNDEYYSEDNWIKRIGDAEKNYGNYDAPLQLFIAKKAWPETIIGYCNFSNIVRGAFQACHLGFALSETSQRQGIMAEALKSAIHYMFAERNFHRIIANYMVNNDKSAALLHKLGFEEEGRAPKYLLINGKWRDHILTSLINDNWNSGE